jgi:hypothetical protein
MKLSRRILMLALVATPALAQGSPTPLPFHTDVMALKPGEWTWDPELAPAGPMLLVVNLSTQRAFVYRNGVRIGASTVSTGKAGKRTPTGIFQILQKRREHYSNLYNNAPMPFMQRLTWDGIALHAGNLPGYPASHGCIRLPYAFAEALFSTTTLGMTVVILDEAVTPESPAANAVLSRFAPAGRQVAPADDRSLSETEVARWNPDRASEGPVTIVLSTSSRKLIVYRGGVEIGRARVTLPPGFRLGTRAAQFAGRDANGVAQWVYLGLSSHAERKGQRVEQDALDAVRLPPQFMAQLREVVGEGTTLLATDGGLTAGSTGKPLTILTHD